MEKLYFYIWYNVIRNSDCRRQQYAPAKYSNMYSESEKTFNKLIGGDSLTEFTEHILYNNAPGYDNLTIHN